MLLSNTKPTDSTYTVEKVAKTALLNLFTTVHANLSTQPTYPGKIKLILDMRRRNPDADLVVFWVKRMQRGCKHSISGLYRFLKK